jgi:ATP-binding cassette subfamily B protein
MNLHDLLKAVTLGQPKRLRHMILWSIAEYAFRGAPYGVMLLVIWELFKPLQNPGTVIDTAAIARLWFWLLGSLLVLYALSRKSYFALYYDGYDLTAEGRLSLADHLRSLSMGFFNSRDPGDVTAYLVSDYANVEMLLTHIIAQIFGGATLPLVVILTLMFVDWRMALAAALVIPLAWPATLLSTALLTRLGKKHQKSKNEAAARMIEYVQGMRLIKAFNLRGTRFERLERIFDRLKVDSIRLEAGIGPTMLLTAIVLHSGLTVIILLGLYLLLGGTLGVREYIMFLIMGSVFTSRPCRAHVERRNELLRPQCQRIYEAHTVQPLPEPAEDRPLDRFDIAFKHVNFRYNDTDVLKDVSFTAPEHSLTALVGPSGSGKTTITRLIARFGMWTPARCAWADSC